uniref:Uncharacterized protein n=1 Tax=Acrobeloides nanus TaxID=290746 RepID=A0A914DGR5_9BILA
PVQPSTPLLDIQNSVIETGDGEQSSIVHIEKKPRRKRNVTPASIAKHARYLERKEKRLKKPLKHWHKKGNKKKKCMLKHWYKKRMPK